jgi:peptidoglycan/LPS O-acetylase OafA/YrhL
MFGYLRFILANIVLFSHTGISPEWGNLGATSVTIFYMLSGFVITNILNNFLIKQENIILKFYIDRFLRIFPLYILILLFYYLYLFSIDTNFEDFLFIENLVLIPCNYIDKPIIPVSWSLALEFQLFILMPLLFRQKILFYIIGFISISIFLLSNLSFIDKYTWGYYKLPGVIFIFFTGSLIANNNNNIEKFLPLFISFVSLCGLFFIEIGLIERGAFQSEVLLGIFLGVLLIILLKDSRRIIFNNALGSMSYSIFLVHYLFIFIFKDFNLNSFSYNLCIFSSSLIFSIATYNFMEKKLANWRIHLN